MVPADDVPEASGWDDISSERRERRRRLKGKERQERDMRENEAERPPKSTTRRLRRHPQWDSDGPDEY